jgi:ABC-type uncharacterized transport system auxiliary subunit
MATRFAWKTTLVLTLATTLLTGCLGPRTLSPTRYYHLNLPAPEAVAEKPSPISLGLRPLFPALHIERSMAYRETGNTIAYREEEWAEKPADMVLQALRNALDASGAFHDVGYAGDMARPDWVLTGEVNRFNENRTQKLPTAELEVRLEVRTTLGIDPVWSKTLSVTTEMPDGGASALAQAMSEALAQLTQEATTQIVDAIGTQKTNGE